MLLLGVHVLLLRGVATTGTGRHHHHTVGRPALVPLRFLEVKLVGHLCKGRGKTNNTKIDNNDNDVRVK